MASQNKFTSERTQRAVLELAANPGNDVCADCKARQPRWASYNLGIFICMNCASIHRKIGTHVSKVKSLTMDSWTKEQVEVMKQNGNIKSNALYNPNEHRNPPPTNMMEIERDSELEQYIRSKYEYKRFIDRSALVASKLGPSRSASSLNRSQQPRGASQPIPPTTSATLPPSSSPPSSLSANRPSTASATTPSTVSQTGTTRSASQPFLSSQPLTQQFKKPLHAQTPPKGPLWDDLVSLQSGPSTSSSLPLQFQPTAQQFAIPNQGQNQPNPNTYANLSVNTGYNAGLTPTTPFSAQGSAMGMSSNSGMNMNMGMGVGLNPFQQQQQQQQQQAMGYSQSPSSLYPQGAPGTFTQQSYAQSSVPTSGGFSGNGGGTMAGSTLQPFGQQNQLQHQQSFTQQHQLFQAQQPLNQSPIVPSQPTQQFFQPQPQAPDPQQQQGGFMPHAPQPLQQQGFLTHSPQPQQQFMSHSPYGGGGGTPSPYGQQQQLPQQGHSPFGQPQLQQHPGQQQMFVAQANPYTGWAQGQGQQGVYQGQQWGGM